MRRAIKTLVPVGSTRASKTRQGLTRVLCCWLGWLGAALLLVDCKFPFGDYSPCDQKYPPPTDAGAIVMDPIDGTHHGQLTWIETGATTDLTITVTSDGPPIPDEENKCPGAYVQPLDFQITSSDGLIGVSVPHSLEGDAISTFVIDAPSLLAGGVAPAQPDLASPNPTILLELDRDLRGGPAGWSSGTVRATTADQAITLGIIKFESGS
jgi:hypothetical protein